MKVEEGEKVGEENKKKVNKNEKNEKVVNGKKVEKL